MLPAPPRLHEWHAIWKADRGRGVLEPPFVRRVTAYAFGPMARHNARIDIVDGNHVGAAITASQRRPDEIGGTGR